MKRRAMKHLAYLMLTIVVSASSCPVGITDVGVPRSCESLAKSLTLAAPVDTLYVGRGIYMDQGLAKDRSGRGVCGVEIRSEDPLVAQVLGSARNAPPAFVFGLAAGTARITTTLGALSDTVTITVRPPVSDYSAISTGGLKSCALDGQRAYCWAANVDRPVRVRGDGHFSSISAGSGSVCALDRAGEAFCGLDQLPMALAESLRFVAIEAGSAHVCALTAAGDAYCWGEGSSGELGNGVAWMSPTPVQVTGGIAFTAITAGLRHTCGIAADSTALCWGNNEDLALGRPYGTERCFGTPCNTIPQPVSGGLHFVSVAAGGAFTCGVTETGAAWCWGDGAEGQLGNGSTIYASATPVRVSGTSTFRLVVAGSAHACGLLADSTAVCWGSGYAGQLGNGSMTGSSQPTSVQGGLLFRSLSAAEDETCGIAKDNLAYCWGLATGGQLGNGEHQSSSTPSRVLGQR